MGTAKLQIRVTLPKERPAALMKHHDSTAAADATLNRLEALFDYFDIDKSAAYAEVDLCLRLAALIFPAFRSEERGRRAGDAPKHDIDAVVTLADAFDLYLAAERSKAQKISTSLPSEQIILRKFISLEVNKKKLLVNGRAMKPSAVQKLICLGRAARVQKVIIRAGKRTVLPLEVGWVHEALCHAAHLFSGPFPQAEAPGELASRTMPLRLTMYLDELESLDPNDARQLERLNVIKAEVEQLVPTSISLGMIKLDPYWLRKKSKQKKKRQ